MEIVRANAVEGPPTVAWLATHSVSISIFLQHPMPNTTRAWMATRMTRNRKKTRPWDQRREDRPHHQDGKEEVQEEVPKLLPAAQEVHWREGGQEGQRRIPQIYRDLEAEKARHTGRDQLGEGQHSENYGGEVDEVVDRHLLLLPERFGGGSFLLGGNPLRDPTPVVDGGVVPDQESRDEGRRHHPYVGHDGVGCGTGGEQGIRGIHSLADHRVVDTAPYVACGVHPAELPGLGSYCAREQQDPRRRAEDRPDGSQDPR